MSLSKMPRIESGCLMTLNRKEHVLRVLGEAAEPLYCSEIAVRLNRELPPDAHCDPIDLVKLMLTLDDELSQLSDGRWTLKHRVD
jgi:hypothetical protein